ncbi:MAG: hypothetical protein DRQ01_02995 [Ignavibacteriae bacterium]|nr:MAG: hypothetical protein DRQ01_02995 [Ignavibacteriota bacterium]
MDESVVFGDPGDYFLSAAGFVSEVENVPKIITVVLGEDLYDPPAPLGDMEHIDGPSEGDLVYDVVNKSELTGNHYEVTFQIDSGSADYATFWQLKNITTNTVLIDSSAEFLFGSTLIDQEVTEGFITKIEDQFPKIDSPMVAETLDPWFNSTATEVFYVGTDLMDQSRTLPGGGTKLTQAINEFTRGDQLKRVELRFGDTGKNKAFRYLMGYVGPAIPLQRQSYYYAAGVTTANPDVIVDISEIGKLGEGIVDVPFTAWVVDDYYGEYQLAVGFLEKRVSEGGNPDGEWDPGTDADATGEYIFLFNTPYDDLMPTDPNEVVGLGKVHTGYQGIELTWANFVGYEIPEDVTEATPTDRLMASNAFFNILYTVAIHRDTTGLDYTTGDKFIINVETYPYTALDVYQFQTVAGGILTENEERELFKKVNVYPNPLYGFNVATSYTNSPSDEPWVTFSNLPEVITIRIYSLSGQLLRTLTQPSTPSPFLRWDLKNESRLRVASGLYLAIVSSPKYGEKVLKFSIIMPEKQIQKF